jgi:hypothetical protein
MWLAPCFCLGFSGIADGREASILANSVAMQNTFSSAATAAATVVIPAVTTAEAAPALVIPASPPAPESGGPTGPEPTRYGDWEKNGRCIDF